MVTDAGRNRGRASESDPVRLVHELHDYEDAVRQRLEERLDREASEQQVRGCFPFAGGWYEAAEIQRIRRRAWRQWLMLRVEALALIGIILLVAGAICALLIQWLPQ